MFCGAQFSLALSKSGSLFTWGKGDNHRLGHNTEEHVRYPKQVKGLAGEESLCFCWGYSQGLEAPVVLLGHRKVLKNDSVNSFRSSNSNMIFQILWAIFTKKSIHSSNL